jgi:predicted nucleotidyltransferase component of viral defense system
MSIDIIKQRLANYHCKNLLEEELALKEITQEVILMALSRENFFASAEFHGGTALRIFYGLQRFSEDLDFALLKPNKNFSLLYYLKNLSEELRAFGYFFEIKDRSTLGSAVKKVFLKDDSIGKIMTLKRIGTTKKLAIKLEIDTNPPLGANTEIRYLDFPAPFGVRTKDLASSFAGKIHALLCRNYVKGRDWYDFIWYVSRETPINFLLLANALQQVGAWKDQVINVDARWVTAALQKKIDEIDWQVAVKDVAVFIKTQEQASLKIWSKEFFYAEVAKLAEISGGTS